MEGTQFESPLAARYASKEMIRIFSGESRYSMWRKLWIALARAQKNLGLPIRAEQILAMEKKIHDIDFTRADYYEKQLGHDVMAHVHAFMDVCPEAKGVIHLGATSCFITDNTDLLLMREGLKLIKNKLLDTIRKLSAQAERYADLPCLGYAHFQTTQPTTVGKRICLWLQDLLLDFQEISTKLDNIPFLGAKGVCGTQASFLQLFDRDAEKVKRMEKMIAEEMGFTRTLTITGQSYTRKYDVAIVHSLASLAVSAHKFATDLRLLANKKEMEEPSSVKQASLYRKPPNRAERICGIARFLCSLEENPVYTASLQWMERTLDDSSNRRIVLPGAFLAADAILNLYNYIASDLVVYPKIIEAHVKEELPFLALDVLCAAAVSRGLDKQVAADTLSHHVQEVVKKWKEEGVKEDLQTRIEQDKTLGFSHLELSEILTPSFFIGRASDQVREFLHYEVTPLLKRYEQVQGYRLNIEI
ncbi:MAG: adenylosuccinate lyase [Chlamydiae bacterium]|nr:adenylosuccinate lyase [Chlamydiota bacterium]